MTGAPQEARYPVPAEWARNAAIDADAYARKYRQSIESPDSFWREEAKRIDWLAPFHTVGNWSFEKDDFRIRWFEGGKLNICANAVDRHLAEHGDRVAILWEPDDPEQEGRSLTYRDLHTEILHFGNTLRRLGAKRGDRITIYLPMIPEALIAMLACARIGAVHSVVFAGFSPEALAGRINDCDSIMVITADGGMRGGKTIPLKANVDKALEQ